MTPRVVAVSGAGVLARGISKQFGIGRSVIPALNDVDLQIGAGQSIALVGPSGSGKTTLLNIIGGLDVPTSGSIIVDGREFNSMSRDALARYRRDTVGFVFQSFRLLPHLTALENIALPLVLAGEDRGAAEGRAAELLARVGLSDRARHRPAQLSAGEQQRVATMRAIAREPRILLADEPTGNLDAASAASVLDLLAELRARDGITLIVATHNDDVAARADRTITLRAGRVEEPVGT